MTGLVILCVLLAIALTAPFFGVDTRFPGSDVRTERTRRGKRYRDSWNSAIAETVERSDFDRTV
jgi:hypothetical protein